jgi:ketosteroid isomerase-like protein
VGAGDPLIACRRQLPSFDVAVVVHIVGRTQELAVDETRSSLLTVSDGRIVRVLSFADPGGAREAAGLPP